MDVILLYLCLCVSVVNAHSFPRRRVFLPFSNKFYAHARLSLQFIQRSAGVAPVLMVESSCEPGFREEIILELGSEQWAIHGLIGIVFVQRISTNELNEDVGINMLNVRVHVCEMTGITILSRRK